MSIQRVLLLVVAAGLMCACSTSPDPYIQESAECARAEALARLAQEKCLEEGGFVGIDAPGASACFKPFADAGKACSDKSQCQGFCRAPDGAAVGARSTGTCQSYTHFYYGCYNEIRKGTVVGGMCFD